MSSKELKNKAAKHCRGDLKKYFKIVEKINEMTMQKKKAPSQNYFFT